MKRDFADDMGEPTAFTGMVYDPNEPFGRVRSPDGGWEELSSQEMKRGRQKSAARRPLHQVENISANIRVCPEDHGHILSEPKVLNEEWAARSTRAFLNSLTLFGVVQPGAVHTSTCSIYWALEKKRRLKTVRFREPFTHVVSWKKREVSRSLIYRRPREPFAETEGRFWEMEESILSHRRWGASNSYFVSRRYAGGVLRRLGFRIY